MSLLQCINRKAKWIAVVCIGSTLDLGCGSVGSASNGTKSNPTKARTYRYEYSMVAPFESKELVYRDEKIQLRFEIDHGAVRYSLKNISNASVVVMTEHASLRVNDASSPVRSVQNYFSSNAESLLITPVPPQGEVDDFVLPKDNVYYDGSKWVEKELFPTEDMSDTAIRKSILKNIGAKVDLVLPIRVGDEQTEHRFSFKVTRIRSVVSGGVRTAGLRLPTPPGAGRVISSGDQWTTIGIVAGLVLLAVYALSQPKKAASDF